MVRLKPDATLIRVRLKPDATLIRVRLKPDTTSMGSDFRSRVLSVVRRIPVGRVATYGDIAELAGAPRAARAVGTVMRDCRDPRVPCHRVIAAGGGLGGFGPAAHDGPERTRSFLQLKRDLLRAEGVDVGVARIRRFEGVRWPGHSNGAEKPASRAGNPGSRARRLTLQKKT